MTTLPRPPHWYGPEAKVAHATWDRVVAQMIGRGFWDESYRFGTEVICHTWQTYVHAVWAGKPPQEVEEWRVELRDWARLWLLVPELEPHLKLVRADGLDPELVAAFGEPQQ